MSLAILKNIKIIWEEIRWGLMVTKNCSNNPKWIELYDLDSGFKEIDEYLDEIEVRKNG